MASVLTRPNLTRTNRGQYVDMSKILIISLMKNVALMIKYYLNLTHILLLIGSFEEQKFIFSILIKQLFNHFQDGINLWNSSIFASTSFKTWCWCNSICVFWHLAFKLWQKASITYFVGIKFDNLICWHTQSSNLD